MREDEKLFTRTRGSGYQLVQHKDCTCNTPNLNKTGRWFWFVRQLERRVPTPTEVRDRRPEICEAFNFQHIVPSFDYYMAFRCGLLEVYMAELTSTATWETSDVDHREAKFARLENTSVVIKFINASGSRTLHNEEGARFIPEVHYFDALSQCRCLSYLFPGMEGRRMRLRVQCNGVFVLNL